MKPDIVAVERDFGRGYHVLVMLGGLRTVAELAAAQAAVRCITDLDASTARTLAGVGGGSTSKDVAGARARMFFNLPTQTADEVDAVILLRAVEARLREEAMEARLKAAAKATKRLSRRAA